jgi:hypothetical protein
MRDWTEVNLYIKKRILGEKRDDKKGGKWVTKARVGLKGK